MIDGKPVELESADTPFGVLAIGDYNRLRKKATFSFL
jgi:hypothetical protein